MQTRLLSLTSVRASAGDGLLERVVDTLFCAKASPEALETSAPVLGLDPGASSREQPKAASRAEIAKSIVRLIRRSSVMVLLAVVMMLVALVLVTILALVVRVLSGMLAIERIRPCEDQAEIVAFDDSRSIFGHRCRLARRPQDLANGFPDGVGVMAAERVAVHGEVLERARLAAGARVAARTVALKHGASLLVRFPLSHDACAVAMLMVVACGRARRGLARGARAARKKTNGKKMKMESNHQASSQRDGVIGLADCSETGDTVKLDDDHVCASTTANPMTRMIASPKSFGFRFDEHSGQLTRGAFQRGTSRV
jgi:hypothetical protein